MIGAEFPPRPKRTHVLNPLSNAYRCKDGRWFILSMVNEARQYAPFMQAIGLEHLTEKYEVQMDRQTNSPELIEIYDRVFSEKTLERMAQDPRRRRHHLRHRQHAGRPGERRPGAPRAA